MKKWLKRAFSALICCLLVATTASASAVFAAGGIARSSYRTVRVGWYKSPMFQEGFSDDEVKSGYCYDYLQKVADYTFWKYEYVYGNWEELF